MLAGQGTFSDLREQSRRDRQANACASTHFIERRTSIVMYGLHYTVHVRFCTQSPLGMQIKKGWYL